VFVFLDSAAVTIVHPAHYHRVSSNRSPWIWVHYPTAEGLLRSWVGIRFYRYDYTRRA
jgi:hypothetical protein